MRILFLFLILMNGGLLAQTSEYAGQQNRAIKTLSVAEVEGYLSGKGMGLAKAAELNHYPGPKHVLDLAKKLELSADQIRQTKQLFGKMKKEAVPLGKKLVEAERELNRLFDSGKVNEENLRALLIKIGTIQSSLRYVHLKAHLTQKKILSPKQVKSYDTLRGYHEKNGRKHEMMNNHKCG